MSPAEHEAVERDLEKQIKQQDALRRDPSKSLAQKIEHARNAKALREALRQHKLQYFDLIS